MKTIGILTLILIIMLGCKSKTNKVCLSGDLSALPDLKSSIHKEVTFERGVILKNYITNSNFINENSLLLMNNSFSELPRLNTYVLTLSFAGTELVYANEDHIALIDSIPSKINELIELIKIQPKEQSEQRAKMEIINRNIQMIKAELNKNL